MAVDLQDNPYAPNVVLPRTNPLQEIVSGDAEVIRRKYLAHEASTKSIGTLYLISGVIGLILGFVYLIGAVSVFFMKQPPGAAMSSEAIGAMVLAFAVFVLVFGAFQVSLGRGLKQLAPWTKTPATVLSAIGLLVFPLGTIVSAYFLFLLASQKGTMVFSPEYANVMKQTPHIKYKTSIVVWIVFALILMLIIFAITTAFSG